MDFKNRIFLHRLFLGVLVLGLLLLLPISYAFASPLKSYYDWGSYYSPKQQVLGITISSLEKLPTPVIPKEAMPPQAQGILPGNPLYNLEILTENIQLTLTFNPIQKERQRLAFASERLSEIKTLADQGKSDLANDTASIYKNTMNTVSQNLETLSSQKTQGSSDLLAEVEKTAASHAVVAQSLALSSPPDTTSFWGKVINATENLMDATADALNQPAIPEDLSVSIQNLKEQGLITPEESDKLYRLPERSDVRDELNKLVASGQFPQAEAIKLNNAVAVKYPDNYKDTQEVIGFAELRGYETLTPPSIEIQNKINEWQNLGGEIPPSEEIRPYLYYNRAEELARKIDFARFEEKQQSEVARFYPESVVQNPTFSGTPITPTPSPSISPQKTPSEKPNISAPSSENYLADYQGPLPGTFGYFFKSVGEQAALVTSFNNPARRLELEMKYADERLREAHALSLEKGKEKLYEETLNRYQTIVNSASSAIANFNGSEEEKRDLARSLESESARHNAVFEKGLLPPPAEDTKTYTSALNATENAMDATSDALGRPALPQTLSNRLQDLKAQGIILEEEIGDLTNARSRKEVREKIRDLVELGSFPPADAKKLDEAQSLIAPSDFNELVEVRKIEELQNLRAIQTEFAQTATLKKTKDSYEQRANTLFNTIDPNLIKIEDLAGQEELIKTYKEIAAKAPKRPINAGQFGPNIIPGTPLPKPPASSDAVLGTCPIGALFKQSEGCVWEDTGKRIDDYSQYRCERPAQYWSFAAKACVPMDLESPGTQDSAPSCPIGYKWSWDTSSCQLFTGGGTILPSPQPETNPSKSCPQGASYKAPKGCVWDANDKPVYDETQYRCSQGSYYSFSKNGCVPNPDPKKPFPDDASPQCQEKDMFWNWAEGKCSPEPKPYDDALAKGGEILTPKPVFATPGNPFYFLKQAVEAAQVATAFDPQTREEVKISQAKERFAEAYALLEKDNEKGFKDSLAKYTGAMQAVYNDIDKGLSLDKDEKKELGEKLASEVANQNLLLQKVSVLASEDVAGPISAATSVIIQGVDRASDLAGNPAIPPDIKEKLDALPKDMLSEKQKQKLLEADTRVEARLLAGELAATGALTKSDLNSLDNWIAPADSASILQLNEIKKLDEAAQLTNLKEDIAEKVEKTEEIAKKLDEFKRSFEPGKEIPADIRPYLRLTRIDEISQTIRPDMVRLEDFGNRKDLQLAVATLQQEFKPTREDFQRLAEFRRSSPGRSLPPELARIEALSYSIGVRDNATACFLPSPPFAPNTPCPSSGAAIPISSYYINIVRDTGSIPPPFDFDKDGKPLVYGKGPEATKPGVCSDGYHWMYDNGGWCMSNSANYSFSSSPSSYQSPYPSTPGYTPYSSYYSAPGAPPQGYTGGYGAPYYYGTAPTSYTTNPPPGTVPGTGPAPTASGSCPSGYHWMEPSGGQAGWCMANGGTYVGGSGGYSVYSPAGYTDYSATPSTAGGYNCGGRSWDPVLQRCSDGACPGGFSWDGSKCAPFTSPSYSGGYYGGSNYSPSSYQYGCTPGYFWDGSRCAAGSYEGSNWSDTAARAGSYCQPPSSGCGSNSYWDYGSCSCRTSSSYSGPSSPSGPSAGCSNYPSGGCGSNSWFDWGTCSCRTSTTTSTGSYSSGWNPTSGSCTQQTCRSGEWFDWGTCSCRPSGNTYTGTTSGGSSSGSCPSGSHWMSDNGGYCMSDGGSSNTSPSGGSSSSSSGSCPSGYHWMSDNGGWCMSDGASGGSSSGGGGSTSTPTTTTTAPAPAPAQTTTSTESTPPPTTTTTTTESSSPPPSSSEPAPAPAP